MSIVITGESYGIKIVNDGNITIVPLEGSIITCDWNTVFINAPGISNYKVKHSLVVTPVTTTAFELSEILKGYLGSAGSPDPSDSEDPDDIFDI